MALSGAAADKAVAIIRHRRAICWRAARQHRIHGHRPSHPALARRAALPARPRTRIRIGARSRRRGGRDAPPQQCPQPAALPEHPPDRHPQPAARPAVPRAVVARRARVAHGRGAERGDYQSRGAGKGSGRRAASSTGRFPHRTPAAAGSRAPAARSGASRPLGPHHGDDAQRRGRRRTPGRGPAAGRDGPDAHQLRARRRDGLAPDGGEPASRGAGRRAPLCRSRRTLADPSCGPGAWIRSGTSSASSRAATPPAGWRHRLESGSRAPPTRSRARRAASAVLPLAGSGLQSLRTRDTLQITDLRDRRRELVVVERSGRSAIAETEKTIYAAAGETLIAVPRWFGSRRFRGWPAARRGGAHRAAGWRHTRADQGPGAGTPGAAQRRRATDGAGARPLHVARRVRSCPGR